MTRRQAVPIIKAPVTWILVADSRQAQVYTRQKVEKVISLERRSRRNQFAEAIASEPVQVSGMKWEAESAEQYETGRDRLGRVQESANAAHHSCEPRLHIHEEIREHFAHTIASALTRAKEEKAFDRLVLVAAPKMLGEIKKHLDAKVLKCVAAEMPKDLTHYEGNELAKHLDGIA